MTAGGIIRGGHAADRKLNTKARTPLGAFTVRRDPTSLHLD
jgi:hypothetical protein